MITTFQKKGAIAKVEIYHGAHGKFETRAPVRTFVPMIVGNEPSVLAAYTCTPLVQFPIRELKPGAKIGMIRGAASTNTAVTALSTRVTR